MPGDDFFGGMRWGALRGALATPLAYTGANGSQQAAQLSPRAASPAECLSKHLR